MFNRIGQIVKPVFMADGSVRLLLELGELLPEDVSELCRLKNGGNINIFLAPEDDMLAIKP
jgi:hypothetical protein